MDKILILDFGGQSTQLIGRRIRQLGHLQRDRARRRPAGEAARSKGRGASSSPARRTPCTSTAPRRVDQRIYDLGIPILGICYGLQRISADHGGAVESLGRKEFGRARVDPDRAHGAFRPASPGVVHLLDEPRRLGHRARRTDSASSPGRKAALPAAFVNEQARIWGVQFHPEASHCEYGMEILRGLRRRHLPAQRGVEHAALLCRRSGRARAGASGPATVVLLISGGVDSCVVAALLLKSLPGTRCT